MTLVGVIEVKVVSPGRLVQVTRSDRK